MYNVETLRERVINRCEICKGAGMVEDKECDCKRKYRVLVNMLMSGFPEEIVYKIERGEISREFDILNGLEFFKYGVENYKDFLNSGLSLVFYGSGSVYIASFFVFSVLNKDYLIDVGFNCSDKELCVYDLNFGSYDDLERCLSSRKSHLKSNLVCLDDLNILGSISSGLRDILEWDGKNFCGEIFRGIEVCRKEGAVSRWKV